MVGFNQPPCSTPTAMLAGLAMSVIHRATLISLSVVACLATGLLPTVWNRVCHSVSVRGRVETYSTTDTPAATPSNTQTADKFTSFLPGCPAISSSRSSSSTESRREGESERVTEEEREDVFLYLTSSVNKINCHCFLNLNVP